MAIKRQASFSEKTGQGTQQENCPNKQARASSGEINMQKYGGPHLKQERKTFQMIPWCKAVPVSFPIISPTCFIAEQSFLLMLATQDSASSKR